MAMTHLSWETLEYQHVPRSSDWFWGLGIIAVGGAIVAVIFGNVLFGLVIAIGAISLGLHALCHPKVVSCEITSRGIMLDTVLFPYSSLQSFWIREHTIPNQLVLTSRKVLMPHVTVFLEGVSAEEVREVLLEYLDEEETHETFSDRVLELFGF